MKLRTRLLAGVSIYQLLLALVGLIGLLSAQASLRGMELAVEHHIAELSTLGLLTSEVDHIHSLALLHGLTESADEQAAYEAAIAESEARARSLLSHLVANEERFGDHDEADEIREFRRSWTAYLHIQDEQLLTLTGPGHDEEIDALTASNGPLAGPYADATGRLGVLQARLANESTERLTQAKDDFARNRDLLLVTTLLAGCLGIGLGLHQSARLGRAVEAVSQAARRVAGGDLSQRVRVATGDEIESLAESFNTMTTNLEQMTTAQSAHLSEVEAANRALQTEVTERRRAEQALRESETRFRSVTQSVKEAIVSTDRQGNITFWNRGAERIFGYREDEALGMPFHRLLAASARADETCTSIERWVGQTTELVGLSRTGKLIPVELSVSEWAARQDLFYTATLRDITERRAMDQLKNEFVSMVSHELRTPMSGVIGMVDLLLRTELSSRQRAYAAALEQSGQSLLSIIDDIVDFSKIEAGKFELEAGAVDVRDLVEGTAGLLAEQASSKGLEITYLVEADVPNLLGGDPRRVRQVLLNLIGNAVKFTEVGEVVVHVQVQDQTAETATVRFEISDTGIGIPRELRQRLFQPFVQVHVANARPHGGTGLGLAISKRLVELMGGTVGAEAGPRCGSTFWFTVPFARREDTAGLPSLPAPARGLLDGLRVLVVDDNPTTRAALEQQLGAWEVAAATAGDASDALMQLRAAAEAQAPYAIVLVDYQLPNRETPGLARAILADPHLRGTRLVALTPVAASNTDVANDLPGPAIEKPVRRARLLEVLTELVSPTGPTEDQPDPGPASTRPPAASRILVIEDTQINQLAAANMLEELGYEADVVASGGAGLEALARGGYAAVLMDCQMPGLDGFQTTAEIRRREGPGRRTPIIAITASAMLGDRERCLAAGMDDYLSKPVRLATLAATLERWVPVAANGDAAIDRATLVDLNRIGARVQQNVLPEMVHLFHAEAPERLAALEAALGRHDVTALRVAAHTLRGTSAAVGARDVRDLSHGIEQAALRGDLAAAGRLVRRDLPRAVERARVALQALLDGQAGATCES